MRSVKYNNKIIGTIFVNEADRIVGISEASASTHLRVNLLDTDRLVKANELKEITNPITFSRNNTPTPDGLLSNEIFGITMYDRMNTCAYIDLHEWFMNPELYKVWSKMDKKIIACVNETKYFSIDEKGELVEDENGSTGVEFLRKNFDKINIARTASIKRDMNVDFVNQCKKTPGAFIRKMIVIPAGLRDVDTSKGGRVSIGEINELYRNLILACRALKESGDYGLDMVGATRGRIQNTLVQIFDYFGNGTTINGNVTGPMVPGKTGVLRRAVMSKTTDYASRLVMSAPDLRVETVDDMQSDLDYASIPLHSIISNFTPYIIFAANRYIENMFSGGKGIPYIDPKTKEEKIVYPKDYQVQFSEERIKKEMDRFRMGYSNRLIPFMVETTESEFVHVRFKGFNTTKKQYESGAGNMPIVERDFTWCDFLYICAVEACADKHVLVSRYPIDSIYNQFPVRVHISTTNETEPMVVDGKFYPNYPKIRQEYIGQNTSSMFVNSVRICNLFLDGLNGDYDGDTVTIRPVYTNESNEELEKVMNSNFNLIGMGGKPIRNPGNEAFQALYNMTLVLPDAKGLSTPEF